MILRVFDIKNLWEKINMEIKKSLNRLFQEALTKIGIDENLTVSETTKPEFGDYQFNGAMALAKKLKKAPRLIAQDIIENLPENKMIKTLEIAGAGFINIRLKREFLEENILKLSNDKRLLISKTKDPKRVVVDYSSPNMAKEMHVGHLRSTIIGDSLANLFEFLGDEVIRQNHIGDWGTQFGMLIAYLEELGDNANRSLSDIEEFYKKAKKRFDSDKEFANLSREYVVKLQSGDVKCLELWEKFIDKSLSHCEEVYSKLGVKLKREDVKAESSYNEELPKIIEDLEKKGLLVESQGAKCVFIEGEENPLIVQKSDGGYLYATTDLAAIRFRVKELKAKRISYVVDARQSEHFKQVFKVAKMAGYVDDEVLLEHIAFGVMLDKNGKPFKTRDGGTVKLISLLEEAVKRAKKSITKREEYLEDELEKVAQIIGIGAVKYSDLSINRESDYIFDWDKMLNLNGNTSLYQQYAYARIQSIFRKFDGNFIPTSKLEEEIEQKLALKLLQFEDILQLAYKEAKPHYITTYLYELTTMFMKFYESCPILKDEIESEIKLSRLTLAKAVGDTIKIAFKILGIGVLDKI
jgi:arginyl-tRNA synthetase